MFIEYGDRYAQDGTSEDALYKEFQATNEKGCKGYACGLYK